MLEKIYLSRIDDNILATDLVVEFTNGVNIIIGPKGGGKSTLFDLVACLSKRYISESTVQALKAFNLKFSKAVYTDGEELLVQNLSHKSKKDKDEDFRERNDVIFQDDPIKKDINNLTEISKQKEKYIKDLLSTTDCINVFKEQLQDFHMQMRKIYDLKNQTDINWSNSFKFTQTKTHQLKLLLDLNFQERDLNSVLKRELDTLDDVLNFMNAEKNRLNIFSKNNFNLVFKHDEMRSYNQAFITEYEASITAMLKQNDAFVQLINKRSKMLKTIQLMNESFRVAYKKTLEQIKAENFVGQGMISYEKQAKDFFKNLATLIISIKHQFHALVDQDIVLKFDDPGRSTELLTYKVKPEVKLNQDLIYDILKVVLPTPGNAVSDINKWINAVIKSDFKEFDYNKIINRLTKAFESEVIVEADKRNYETMSLGEKSIFGIKYKYERSKNQDLFLDQPEDNLDNYTISHNIIQMLQEKPKNCQIFIVTHNANIGILTNTNRVIVANLSNNESPYAYGTITKTEKAESDLAHYLEGGAVALEKRYNKIIKGE